MSFDPFLALKNARREELRGWCVTAALLHGLHKVDGWWEGYGVSESETLNAPEIQLAASTARQYREVWETFGHLPVDELETCRPRLLYQMVEPVKAGRVTAEEALADVRVMGFHDIQERRKELMRR